MPLAWAMLVAFTIFTFRWCRSRVTVFGFTAASVRSGPLWWVRTSSSSSSSRSSRSSCLSSRSLSGCELGLWLAWCFVDVFILTLYGTCCSQRVLLSGVRHLTRCCRWGSTTVLGRVLPRTLAHLWPYVHALVHGTVSFDTSKIAGLRSRKFHPGISREGSTGIHHRCPRLLLRLGSHPVCRGPGVLAPIHL